MKINADITKLEARKLLLEQKLEQMNNRITPLWSVVQTKIVRDLLHPESEQFSEMDELLRKLEILELDKEGKKRLGVLLEERILSTDAEVTEDERESARIMKVVMEKVLGDFDNQNPLSGLQIVGEKQVKKEE